MNEQRETFSFSPPLNLVEEGNWLLAVTSFEGTIFVFNKTDENNSFPISTLGRWNSGDGEEFINEINKLLELRYENDIELHVKEVDKRGIRIEIVNVGYNLAGFDHFKSEKFSELKRVKYRDLEGLAYRLQLLFKTYRTLSIKIKRQTDGYYIILIDFVHSPFGILKIVLEF